MIRTAGLKGTRGASHKNPRVEQWFLPLIAVETGDVVTFVTSSKGGIAAIINVCRVYGHRHRAGQLPIVALRTRSYKHKQFGRIETPDLPIVGWTGSTGDAFAEPPPLIPRRSLTPKQPSTTPFHFEGRLTGRRANGGPPQLQISNMQDIDALFDLQSLARALGGEVSGGQVRAPGPQHSATDRSLSIKLDRSAPDGFLVNSFADDDPIVCRDYVRAKVGLPAFKPYRQSSRHLADDVIERAVMAAVALQSRSDKREGRSHRHL